MTSVPAWAIRGPDRARGASRRRLATALAVCCAAAAAVSVWWTLRTPRGLPSAAAPRVAVTVVAPNGWPGEQARLEVATVAFSPAFGRRRVFIDAGHGAAQNSGNTSCLCVDEQDFTLRISAALRERLEATGAFEVRLSREGGALVEYRDRVAEAERWGAEAFLSIHSDVRGKFDHWSPRAGASCPVSWAAPGFSVLWSDEGDAPLVGARSLLARAVARRLVQAGLPPYGGGEYASLYEGDLEQPGVFVDRHAPDQRIFVLRRTRMPAVLIETHHALDPREVMRWEEPRTLDAFAAAVAGALADALPNARQPSSVAR
jgi:N-acetylmuramoyl-L-alanine amidase